nr:MAG TPA: hypothetical protein [Caudoviricetes sp.]
MMGSGCFVVLFQKQQRSCSLSGKKHSGCLMTVRLVKWIRLQNVNLRLSLNLSVPEDSPRAISSVLLQQWDIPFPLRNTDRHAQVYRYAVMV